jgi:glycosyltransferase involved in cell wall biosynthesis
MLEGLALARGRKIPVHLTLVGASESEMTYCLRRARDLDILDGIDIKGRVSGREIPGLLGKADAGICIWENQPYWQFNPPTKLFEYFVAGLPVLASNIRTHTRYIQHGKNGLIFDYSSVGFADVISELWRRRGQLAELRRRAQESGVVHRWSSIEPHFIEAVEGVVSTHS